MKQAILSFLLIASVVSRADDGIEGAYERVSLTNSRTGESPEAPNRQGLLIMAHGHYSMMTMNPDRRFVPDDEVDDWPAAEQVAYLRDWLDFNGHTGRFEADGHTLNWYRDISENPREVATVATLNYEWRGDLLVIWFKLPNGDRYDWVWKRIG